MADQPLQKSVVGLRTGSVFWELRDQQQAGAQTPEHPRRQVMTPWCARKNMEVQPPAFVVSTGYRIRLFPIKLSITDTTFSEYHLQRDSALLFHLGAPTCKQCGK